MHRRRDQLAVHRTADVLEPARESRTRSSTTSFFKAIRSGKPINSGDYMARSTLMGIMGQLSCYTGKEVTWEQVNASDFYFAPQTGRRARGYGAAGAAGCGRHLSGVYSRA